jgi:hypothetical protein
MPDENPVVAASVAVPVGSTASHFMELGPSLWGEGRGPRVRDQGYIRAQKAALARFLINKGEGVEFEFRFRLARACRVIYQ